MNGPNSRVNGVNLDPLVAVADGDKPLLSKLLAVPALRARYLGYIRDLASRWLDWERLGPVAKQYHSLIAAEVKADTRKLSSNEEFAQSLEGPDATNMPGGSGEWNGRPERRRALSLKAFADQRRAYLLK